MTFGQRKVAAARSADRPATTRIIVKFIDDQYFPTLQLSIYDAPHYRMHHATIQRYREDLHRAMAAAGIQMPIDYPIDVDVFFINPASPDNGNIYLAFERAMDGKTLRAPFILTDDSLISKSTIRKFFPGAPKK